MKEQGVDKHGRRIRKSKGLTKNAQTCNIRNTKQVNEKLGKRADYLRFDWVQFMSKEYFGVIDAINECYRKMLEIGKCKEVFQCVNWNQCELLRAKLKQEFLNVKKNILLHYSCYLNSGAPKLTISINVELAPDPRKHKKFRTRNTYREENYCQGTITRARICNKQPEYSEMQYLPEMSHGEGCYDETRQFYMQKMQR